MARAKADTWYPVSRVVDGLGPLPRLLYREMCRKSSYDNDDYTAGLPVAPITISQLVVTYNWMISVSKPLFVPSRSQVVTALRTLKKIGAVEKVCDEGDFGVRLFLPHQWAIRWPIYQKKQEELRKKEALKKSQSDDRQIAGKSQSDDRQIAGKKAASKRDKAGSVTGSSQEGRRKVAGKSQPSRNNTNNKELITQNREPILDDDDEFSDYDFSELDARERMAATFMEKTKQWYLAMSFTPDVFSGEDQKTLDRWMDELEDYDLSLSDVAEAMTNIGGRVSKDKEIKSLAYFGAEVFSAIKKRIDKRIAREQKKVSAGAR